VAIADPSGNPAGSSFSTEVRADGGHTVLRLVGELDAATSPELWSAIDGLPGSGDLVLDASRLSFVDSTGIGCLFKLQNAVRDRGGMLIVTGCQPSVRRTIEATGLHRVAAVVDGAP
jgi:anti-sigma B factor antagonist